MDQAFFRPMLSFFVFAPFLLFHYRLVGARIGTRALIGGVFTDADLVHIGDDFKMETGAAIQSHLFEERVMKLGTTEIGNNCLLGDYSHVLFDTKMGDNVVLDSLSIQMKGESFDTDSNFVGMPAVQTKSHSISMFDNPAFDKNRCDEIVIDI